MHEWEIIGSALLWLLIIFLFLARIQGSDDDRSLSQRSKESLRAILRFLLWAGFICMTVFILYAFLSFSIPKLQQYSNLITPAVLITILLVLAYLLLLLRHLRDLLRLLVQNTRVAGICLENIERELKK